MFYVCYRYIFCVQKVVTFSASLYKGVVGLLPVPTCKALKRFLKACQCCNNFPYLEHNHIKEQETAF